MSVPLANIAERARTPYLICVFRASKPEQREIYSLPLRERLPAVRVPLRPKDADVAARIIHRFVLSNREG